MNESEQINLLKGLYQLRIIFVRFMFGLVVLLYFYYSL
jgi:hypothetical protein